MKNGGPHPQFTLVCIIIASICSQCGELSCWGPMSPLANPDSKVQAFETLITSLGKVFEALGVLFRVTRSWLWAGRRMVRSRVGGDSRNHIY